MKTPCAFILLLAIAAGLSTSQAQAPPADFRDTLPLPLAQFKATHNSYLLKHTPQEQIDKFDVWEIELDFGMEEGEDVFVVGHDDPDPKHGLKTLGDWVRNALSAENLKQHLLILKLEAKTTGPCAAFRFSSFTCVENWPKDWQKMLVDSLQVWLGPDRWITYREYSDSLNRVWPTVENLAGKVIVTLQDSNEDLDIDRRSDYFFLREIPGLQAAWPPIEKEEQFREALAAGLNRLTMDKAYKEPWAKIRP